MTDEPPEPPEPPEISVLDARLAEIDRRLSSIQTGLTGDISVQRAEPPAEPPAARTATQAASPPAAEAAPPPAALPPPPPAAQAAPPPPALPARVEVAEPPPPSAPPPAAWTGPERLLDDLRALADAHERVLRSTRELLSAYERVLARMPAAGSAAPAVTEFSVSAGPFTSTEALRRFERTLAEIAQVREVSVRGYEGGDRAIVDVHLFEPNT
jgi:hypothetical protein